MGGVHIAVATAKVSSWMGLMQSNGGVHIAVAELYNGSCTTVNFSILSDILVFFQNEEIFFQLDD